VAEPLPADDTTEPAPVRPRDVLGAPVVPPAAATTAVNRLRAGLARLLRAPAPPPVQILEGLLGVLDQAALVALCRAGIPDHLDGPLEIDALAADLGVAPDRLQRLLRYAATRGWVRVDRRGRVRPTPVMEFLRRDHPSGWRDWVEFMSGPEVARALGALADGLAADGDPFESANDAPFFAWMAAHPDRHAAFDAAMATGGRMHGLVLARALDWRASRRVCDVGGGTGALLTTLLSAHPHLEGVLLELPEVAARARNHPRLDVQAGDAFTSVPGGCDTYLLVNVVHDWADEAAARLLAAIAGVLPYEQDARVVIVEGRLHERPRDDIASRTDLLMLGLTPGGHERTPEQFDALARAAGLRRRRTVRLASGDDAHVLVPV
jgi:hypothetical protein